MAFERWETRLFIEPFSLLDGVVPFDFARKVEKNEPPSKWLINKDEVTFQFPPNMKGVYAAYQEEPRSVSAGRVAATTLIGGASGAGVGAIIGGASGGDALTGAAIGGVIGAGTGLIVAADQVKTDVTETYPVPFRCSMIFVKPHFYSAYDYLFWVLSEILKGGMSVNLPYEKDKPEQISAHDALFAEKDHGKMVKLWTEEWTGQSVGLLDLIDIKNDVTGEIKEKIRRNAQAIDEGDTIVYKNVVLNEEEMEGWNLRAFIRCEADEILFINDDGVPSAEKIIEMTPVTVSTFMGKPADYGLKVETEGFGFDWGKVVGGALAGAAIGAAGTAVAAVTSGGSFSASGIKSSLLSAGEDILVGTAVGAAVGAVVGLVAASRGYDGLCQLVKVDFLEYIPSQLGQSSNTNIGDAFTAGTEVEVNYKYPFDENAKWCQYNYSLNRALQGDEENPTPQSERFRQLMRGAGRDTEFPHIAFRNEEQMVVEAAEDKVVLSVRPWEIVEPSDQFKVKLNYSPVSIGNEFINNQIERVRYQRWISRYNDVIAGFSGAERHHYQRRQTLTEDYLIQGVSIDGQAVLKGMEFDESFSSVPERLQVGLPLQVDMRLENTPQAIQACFVDCYIDGEKVVALSPYPPESPLEPVSEFFEGVGLGAVVQAGQAVAGSVGTFLDIPEGARAYTEYWRGFIPAEKLAEKGRIRVKFVATYGAARVESITYDAQVVDNVIMGEAYERVWTEYNEWQLDNRNRFPLDINPEYGVGETFQDRFQDALRFLDAGAALVNMIPPGRPVDVRAQIGDNYVDLFWDSPPAPDPQTVAPEDVTLSNLGDLLEQAGRGLAEQAAGVFVEPGAGETIGILGALDITSYRIYQKSQYDINWKQTAIVEETRIRVSSLEKGVAYEFYVETLDAQGNSSLILDGLFVGMKRGVKGMHFRMLDNDFGKYEVQAGDTYESIADTFDVDVEKLRSANGASDSDQPSEGDVINLIRRHLFVRSEDVEFAGIGDGNIVIEQP